MFKKRERILDNKGALSLFHRIGICFQDGSFPFSHQLTLDYQLIVSAAEKQSFRLPGCFLCINFGCLMIFPVPDQLERSRAFCKQLSL